MRTLAVGRVDHVPPKITSRSIHGTNILLSLVESGFQLPKCKLFLKYVSSFSTQKLTNHTSKILSFEVNQNKNIQGFSSFALTLFYLSKLFQPISLVFQLKIWDPKILI